MRTPVIHISQMLCIIFLLATSSALAQEDYLGKEVTLFVNYYNKKDFSNLTNLFHFPQKYTEKELRKDKNGVSKVLKILFDEFGNIASIEKVNNPPLFYYVLIGGGDIPYWQRYPEVYNSTYKVMFSGEGQGYLGFGFCNILKKWEIRQVSYGLPADSPQSRARIGDILQKVNKLMGQ
jgi:hypothetical protein